MSSIRTGWIIGGAILVLLVTISAIGRGTHYRLFERAPAVGTPTQP
jgi:hypothetical protein